MLLFGGIVVLLLPDRRRLLPTAPGYGVRFVPGAVLGGVAGAAAAVAVAATRSSLPE